MKKDIVFEIENPEVVDDPLTELLRQGAQKLIAEAVEAELEEFIDKYRGLRDTQGRQRIVRNGYQAKRQMQTGIGDIEVQGRRAKDRGGPEAQERLHYQSAILPPYLRRTKSIETLLPWLYLKGISSGDFTDTLKNLLGPGAKGLSANTISRLKEAWQADFKKWQKRDLSKKQYVYFWVDGIYFNVRMEKENLCLLVIVGATVDGKKEFVAIEDGYREDAQSWKELLLKVRHQGLVKGPELAIGDGALGFWKAFKEVYGRSRWQRCWVHKTANVLSKFPKSLQDKAKAGLHEIWMADTKENAKSAFDLFITTYQAKYPKATECLEKDRDALLAFYDFPAEHWKHIRTTNPIESTFATVVHRTYKSKGCLSRMTALTMVYQLILQAEKNWQRLQGSKLLAEVVEGVKFTNGMRVEKEAA